MADDLASVPQLSILISSTRADLMQYREEASKVIGRLKGQFERRLQIVEVSMEKEVQSGERELAVEVSKRWVQESDCVVLIVGWRYGTISPDPRFDGISVTEWEYRHACELQKKVFAFVVGEPGSVNVYRELDAQAPDLKDTMYSETDAHRTRLKAFKESLASTHLEYFKNLKHFSERLEETLRAAITLPVEPGSDLAELLLAVRPSIQQCIDRVKVIAAYKRVHDQLHDLRQNVVRPILEWALVQWRADRELGIPVATGIQDALTRAEMLARNIETETVKLSASRGELLSALAAVVSGRPRCDFKSGTPDLDELSRSVSRFAGVVQRAFTLADGAMLRDSNVLDDLHVSLLKHIGTARQRRRLNKTEEQTLDDLLERAERTKKYLIEILNGHHNWQSHHDRLQILNAFKKTEEFGNQLAIYSTDYLPELRTLVESETAQITGDPDSMLGPDEKTTLANLMASLCTTADALGESPGVPRFDSMRKTFDDGFFLIDKRTLKEVDRSANAVRNMENELEVLARKQSELDSPAGAVKERRS